MCPHLTMAIEEEGSHLFILCRKREIKGVVG
jgi:hypothetical protein